MFEIFLLRLYSSRRLEVFNVQFTLEESNCCTPKVCSTQQTDGNDLPTGRKTWWRWSVAHTVPLCTDPLRRPTVQRGVCRSKDREKYSIPGDTKEKFNRDSPQLDIEPE
jgi:hypothetical protein